MTNCSNAKHSYPKEVHNTNHFKHVCGSDVSVLLQGEGKGRKGRLNKVSLISAELNG